MAAESSKPGSTTQDVRPCLQPPSVWARRAAMTGVAALVAAGLVSALGVQTATQATSRRGYDLTLSYPRIARAGLDVTWQVTVRHEGGFGKHVTLAVTGSYFDIFESQGFSPEPASETRDGDRVLLTFTSPPGDTFVVAFDAYVEPAAQRGRAARIAVLESGLPVAWADVDTWLWP